jgi:hypothetical protein
VTYSCVGQAGFADDPADHNVNLDPLFVDSASGDLHLMPGSPCIDAADGTAAPATDIEGNARWDDPGSDDVGAGTPTFADMGAHEFQSTSTPVITITSPADGEVFLTHVAEAIAWTTTGGRVSYVRVGLSRDGGATWVYLGGGTAIPNTGGFDWMPSGPASGGCLLRVSDAADAAPSDTAAFTIAAPPLGGGCGGWVEDGARRPGGAAWFVPFGLALILLARARRGVRSAPGKHVSRSANAVRTAHTVRRTAPCGQRDAY